MVLSENIATSGIIFFISSSRYKRERSVRIKGVFYWQNQVRKNCLWCCILPLVAGRLYALQTGLKIDRKSDGAKALLTSLMDWLETQKKVLADNEAITHEVAAQAHIENYALKLFVYADSQDRAANFGK
jgi:Vta1 like.